MSNYSRIRLVLAYDLLEKRCIDDVVNIFFLGAFSIKNKQIAEVWQEQKSDRLDYRLLCHFFDTI